MSSRSSTSSDLDGFFPNRLGAQLYISEDTWRQGEDGGDEGGFGDDAEEEELVEKRAVCVFDFAAECEGEISIEIGQVVWVEFRKGVSGWLVVKDEITGTPAISLFNTLALFFNIYILYMKLLVGHG